MALRQWGLLGWGAWGQLDEVLTGGSFLCEAGPQLLGELPASGGQCAPSPSPSQPLCWRLQGARAQDPLGAGEPRTSRDTSRGLSWQSLLAPSPLSRPVSGALCQNPQGSHPSS